MIFEKIRDKLYEYYKRYDDMAFIEMNTNGHTLDFEYANGKKDSMGEAIKIINQVEAEYNNGWIPCSERLPEDMQKCLVTARIYFTPDHVDETDNYIGVDFNTYSSRFGWLGGNEVIAWQPLPKSYVPKGE